jgi:hypothetical protein
MSCILEVSAEYVAAMEDVLDLYEEPYDEKRPMVCFDESPTQLIGEVRSRIPPTPGHPECFDVEYQRNGVRDLMMISEAKLGLRKVLITERRTKIEFAQTMRHIVGMYPVAKVIRVVLDNLNTHKMASLYEAFPPKEARAIAKKLEFHYTPKHGSWLNMAEMEFSVPSRTCLAGRVPDEATLQRRIEANAADRNAKLQPINWRFTIRDARRKLHHLYPSTSA